MNKILQSIRPVVEYAQHVRINFSALETFCSTFQGLSEIKPFFVSPSLTADQRMQLSLVYNAVNFCYWGDPKWTVEYQGKRTGGAYGMKACFLRALEEGHSMLDTSYLRKLDQKTFDNIVRGVGELPLFGRRIKFLRDLGKILDEKYEGQAKNLVASTEEDAIKLLDNLTTNFYFYDDASNYHGNKVLFHKRAQLFVHNIHHIIQSQSQEHRGLSQVDELTALADYKVPQLLRKLGIITYSQSLANAIDAKETLPAHSDEEIEIRAFTIEAVDLMVQRLKGKFPTLNAIDLDHFIYLESKKTPSGQENDKPHHRTLTTAY